MGKKRYKDQILASILETCRFNGAPKTKVVYASSMNFGSAIQDDAYEYAIACKGDSPCESFHVL